ncbi:hypothetical protein [Isoptericola jiangsuensis]|uniref:hypothetical protein n=1 Tax=Isoptericola jiangsuensis TaxID=548579 RepID=UPI0014749DD4|nr:hypothetical protein [Isoptericola jiangsuensis]
MRTDVVLTVPADAAAREALLDRLTRLAAVDHDGVEPVGPARADPDGSLRVRRAGGVVTDMATLLTVRGRCAPDEAAGVLVTLAQGLAALHDAGLVHGPLTAADVVVDAEGRPRMRPRLDPPGERWQEADDVHALAGLVAGLTADGDGDELVALRAALAPALAPEPRVRPEAGTFAARVHDAVPPRPVRVPEPATLAAAALGRPAARRADVPGRAGVRHRRARRAARGRPASPAGRTARRRAATRAGRGPAPTDRGRVLVGAGGVVVVVGLLVAVGLHLTGPGTAPAAEGTGSSATSAATGGPGAQAVRDPADPGGAAEALTLRRVALLAGDGDVRDLVLAGSPAETETTALLADAVGSGVRVLDPVVTLHGTRVEQDAPPGTAVVRVDYVVEAHDQVAADGTTTRVPAGPRRTAVLHLTWTDAGWRVTDVG